MNGLLRALIRLLIRCYPRAWRQRYGEEFAALLEQSPLTPTRMADVLRGAFDAHRQHGGLSALGAQALLPKERLFWRRWMMMLGIAGFAGGAIFRLTNVVLIVHNPTQGALDLLWGQLFALPFLGILALTLGIAQRRILRTLVPTISRWWGAMLLLGPAITLAIITTDHSYSLLPDLFSMTAFLFYQMEQASLPLHAQLITLDRLVLSTIIPSLFYFGIVAAFQAYVLKGVIAHAGWWIAIAMLATLAGLGTLRLTAPLHVSGYRLAPAIVRPDLLIRVYAE